MFADIQKKCTNSNCSRLFWLTGAEQQVCHDKKLPIPDRCPGCRTAGTATEISTVLATLEQVRDGQDAFLAKILPDASALFMDIQQLTNQAAAPIHIRPRTLLEWWLEVDLQAQQIESKLRAGDRADQLLRQRLEVLRRYLAVAKTMNEAKDVQVEQHQKKLRAHLETLKLEEEIARQQALRDERIRTDQLEETRKQTRLLNEINPAPPVQPVDPVKQAVDDHRRQFKVKATTKQLVISDFLKELQKAFRADVEDTVKTARIRAVMEAYRQEVDALADGRLAPASTIYRPMLYSF